MKIFLAVPPQSSAGPPRRRRRTSSADLQLRKVLGLSASTQVVAYAVIILYSFWWGSVDFVLPVKYGLLATVGALLYEPFDVLGLQLFGKPRATFTTLGISTWRLIVEVFAAVGILGFSISFILSPYSSISLVLVNYDVKLVASLGVGLPAVFALLELARASKLKDRLFGRGD